MLSISKLPIQVELIYNTTLSGHANDVLRAKNKHLGLLMMVLHDEGSTKRSDAEGCPEVQRYGQRAKLPSQSGAVNKQ
jgi:hypothetical protein